MIRAEVIGDPIEQSKSPLIHGHWLRQLGISADYQRCLVRPDELKDYIESRRKDAQWRGCNITLPHKIAIVDHVADPGGVRDGIGAFNTVFRNEDGILIGTNTDAAGFSAPLMQRDWDDASAIVIGSGGAARAILFALKQLGFGHVTIMARNAMKAMGLLSHFGLKGQVRALSEPLQPADLLVNASALGMKGVAGDFAPDLSALPDHAVVYEIVYSPLETVLLKSARQRQLETIDGLEMLIGQAACAFELFFDQPPPRDDDAALRKMLLA